MSRQTTTALPTGTSGSSSSQCVQTLSSNTASNSDWACLFECPVCFDYVLPPILQCQSGHLVCSNCRPKLTCCPICRGPLGSIRNLAMEKLANSVLFPCKYASGCKVLLPHTDKTEHEELCDFRPYSCPFPRASCKWQGLQDAVMPHLMHQHITITTQGERIVARAVDINLPSGTVWVIVQLCFGFQFMLVLEKQKYNGNQLFFAIVQLIGTRKQARNFAYCLELNRQAWPGQSLTWKSTPRSIHEGIDTTTMNSDCLVFDTSTAQLFTENGSLDIKVTIFMRPRAGMNECAGGRRSGQMQG